VKYAVLCYDCDNRRANRSRELFAAGCRGERASRGAWERTPAGERANVPAFAPTPRGDPDASARDERERPGGRAGLPSAAPHPVPVVRWQVKTAASFIQPGRVYLGAFSGRAGGVVQSPGSASDRHRSPCPVGPLSYSGWCSASSK